jgi:hypothetical protein
VIISQEILVYITNGDVTNVRKKKEKGERVKEKKKRENLIPSQVNSLVTSKEDIVKKLPPVVFFIPIKLMERYLLLSSSQPNHFEHPT